MIGCIIQARIGSTRLPGKILQKIDDNYTIIEYVVNQLKASKKIERIIVATTNLKQDDKVCDYLLSKKIEFFRGSSEDVLDRFFQCSKKYSFDIIIRITADNPLIDPTIVDLVIENFLNKKCDFATNTLERTYPYGTEVEVFSFKVLDKAWKIAKKPSEREHVTPYIRNVQNKFSLINLKYPMNMSHLRYTVDRIEDLELVKQIVKNIPTRPILMKNIVDLYKIKPSIFNMNSNVKHDGYLSSLKNDEEYLKSKNDK